jgi:hypothetical protein
MRMMTVKAVGVVTIAGAAAALALTWSLALAAEAPGRMAAAKSLRCSFPINATGTWKNDGAPHGW